jgi:hypothetical protein
MNLVGKILTVFILVMSIFFCALAVSVYATHKNWRDIVLNDTAAPGKPLGLQQQLKAEQDRYDRLKSEKDNLDARLTAARNAAVQALAKVSNEYDQLKLEHDQQEKQIDGIDQERREALAGMKTAQERLAALRNEIEGDEAQGGKIPGLRKDILQAQKQREQYFNEVLRLTDEKYQALGELSRLRDYQQVLRQDLDKALAVLRKFDLKPEPALYANQPPAVNGKVVATEGDKLVEIDLGSDDGLLPKHTLEVYRPSGYVGRIQVVKTNPDRAVCQIVPGYLKSRIQTNDLVTSRLLR